MDWLLVVRFVAALAIAYLLGGIPWALIIGKRFYQLDLREHGSGNLGATNVFRVLGAKAAIGTLLLDAAKGSVAVVAAGLLVPDSYGVIHEWARVAGMAAAVAGHSYSPYIKLRGGKGVATSAGALFVLTPAAATISLAIFIVVVGVWRMVSLGSIVVAIAYPILTLVLYPGNVPIIVTVFGLAALVLWRHRSNMVRIVRGEESKVSFSKRGSATREPKEGDV